MNLSQLIKQIDDLESGAPSFKKYINEGVYSAPEMKRHWHKLDEGFFKGYDQYLKEVALTPDQIQNIFKQAGQGGGAGADAAKDPGKLAAIVDKVLPTSQAANLEKSLPAPDAGPVQGFEQKAGAAVQGLQVDSGTKQSLMQMIKAGVQKPETQQLILAAVGAGLGSLISKVGPILSMIPGGGPVAAAITGAVVAGGVAVLAAKLRGEDWKSAFKGAIKPALMGGASAVVGNLVTTAVGSMMSGSSADAPASTDNPKASSGQGAVNGDDGTTQKRGDSGWDKMSKTPTNPDGSPMTVDQVNAIKDQQRYGNTHDMSDPNALAGGGMKNGDGTPMTNAQMSAAMDRVAPVAGSAADPNKYYNSLSPSQQQATDNAVVAQARNAGATGSTTRQTYTNNADPADPAVMAQIRARQEYLRQNPAELKRIFGNGNNNFEESFYDKQATLKEWLRRDAQGLPANSVQLYPYVVEGIMDSLKGMFGGKKDAAAPAAGGVSADALTKAWTDAGSPTDSEEVAKILQGAGVPAETVTKVFTDLKIPAPTGKVEPTLDPEKSADPAAAPTDATPTPADAAAQDPTATPADPAAAPADANAAADQAPAPGAEPPATPAATQQSKIGVGQINKIVPTLRMRDLKSVQKNVDGTLAKRQTTTQPTAEGKYVGFYSKFLNKEI